MYLVPGMTLIPQTRTMSCWYASAQMVIRWKRNLLQMSLAPNADPSELSQTVTWEVSNLGITNPQVIQLAKALGLRSVPPQTMTLADIEQLLRKHGPIGTNGTSHIVVISGVDEGSGRRLNVHDPSPVNMGKVEWRPYEWYLSGGAVDSRDTSAQVETVFLYHP